MEQDQQEKDQEQVGKEVIVKEQHLQHTQEMVEEEVWENKKEEESNMALINVNPEAEVKAGFAPVKPGTYVMRIKEVLDRNPEKNDLKLILEFVQPVSELSGIDGQPLKGLAGGVFDYIMLAADKQWKFRQLTEACGMTWGDYDPVMELPQKELSVVLKTEEYPVGSGTFTNKVVRYLPIA